MLRVDLGTKVKARGANEWRNIQVASCGEYESSGDGEVIVNLCRNMIADGVSGDELVTVYRAGTPCFHPAKLSDWARSNPTNADKPKGLRFSGEKSQD